MALNNKAKMKSILIAQALAFVIVTENSSTSELSSARCLALGGSMTALADGVDAARFNPAILGLLNQGRLQIELASLGVNLSNNAFTLADYNKYNGATLSTEDKSDILNKIPNDGLKLKANAEAAAMSLSLGTFVFSVCGVGAADVNLKRDLAELILNGNSFADSISVSGSYSEAIAYGQVGLSYGRSLHEFGERQFAVGGTIKYIHGLGYEEITKLEGLATTLSSGFQGNGELVMRTAEGGAGLGLDLGAALKINRHYTVGARIENLLTSINWDRNTKERHLSFQFDTVTINNSNDSVIISDDTTRAIPSFSTRPPAVSYLGVANTSGKLLWAIDWEQGFKRTAESSTHPRLSIGIEWLQLGMMPLRLGFSTGGGRGQSVSFGSGINANQFYLDVAAVTGTGVSVYSAKGLKLALSSGIRF